MTFGQQVGREDAGRIVDLFFERGGRELDTAYIYSKGASEQILGGLLAGRPRESFRLATKAHPSVKGNLGAAAVREQLEGSLERLKLEHVDLFYLHQPDLDTPVEKTLEACAKMHEEGRFGELGLSNYASWQVADMVHVCRREGWPVPAVYQGMYNGVTRDVERELFPCLRRMGMRFYVYNPLAAGVLAGKYTSATPQPEEGRFKEYPFYVERYWKGGYLRAGEMIAEACSEANVPPAEAALRWLARGSMLDASKGDGIIVGASRLEHAGQNLTACAGDPLPEKLAEVFDEAWELARPECPKYLRP
jgi:aflatoxin B1 aldehyde reductase